MYLSMISGLPISALTLHYYPKSFGDPTLHFKAWPDWAYEFPGRSGPDIQICQTGPAGPDWIRTYLLKLFKYQVRVINSLEIRSLDTNLVSTVLLDHINKKKMKKHFEKKNLLFLKVLKVRCSERKTSGFRTVRILTIFRTSGPDVMSGRALLHWLGSTETRPIRQVKWVNFGSKMIQI